MHIPHAASAAACCTAVHFYMYLQRAESCSIKYVSVDDLYLHACREQGWYACIWPIKCSVWKSNSKLLYNSVASYQELVVLTSHWDPGDSFVSEHFWHHTINVMYMYIMYDMLYWILYVCSLGAYCFVTVHHTPAALRSVQVWHHQQFHQHRHSPSPVVRGAWWPHPRECPSPRHSQYQDQSHHR